MKGVNFNKIDKELELERANSRKNRVKNLNFSLIEDCLADNYEMLKNILVAYNELEPNWLNKYNDKEEEKPTEMQTFIDKDTTIEDILSEASGEDIVELALCVTISNRIAHSITDIMRKKIREYASDSVDKSSEANILKGIRRQFHYSKKDKQGYINYTLSRECEYLGIDVNQFKTDGFGELVEAESTAFYLKEYSLQKMLVKLKDRPDINYGIKDSINKNGKSQKAFVMDLPYYGQFAVHLMDPKLEAQASVNTQNRLSKNKYVDESVLSKNLDEEININRRAIFDLLSNKEYDQVLFEKNNIMLSSNVSEDAEKFLKSLRGMTEEKQLEKINDIEKTNPRYAHYLKVKGAYDTRGDGR